MTEESVTCPHCQRTSYNPNDVANKYCGHCHIFWEDGLPAFFDLKEEDFPFRFSIYDKETNELLQEEIVEGPGALSIHGFDRPTRVVITYPDGRTSTAE